MKDFPDLTVGELREKFAREKDLTPYAVERIDDFLWFAGLIRTEYRGKPPRASRVLTDSGPS